LFTDKDKIKFFDLETGMKNCKRSYEEDWTEHYYSYNAAENHFYYFYRYDGYIRYRCFKFDNFKPRAIVGESDQVLLNQKLDKILSKENLQTTKKEGKSLTDFNLIDQIMLGVSSSDVAAEIKNRKWP
jgi:hypothetical protein